MATVRRYVLKSKIHRATVTATHLDYEGSITIDRRLMEAADLVPYERVTVLNMSNGARFETYVIEGQEGSGVVELNGAAARLAYAGDKVIVLSYAEIESDPATLAQWRPRIVLVDEQNQPLRHASVPER